jgi:predicted nucleotidyltransferase
VTQLEHTLRQAVGDLGAFGVRFALVGGLAVSIRTEPRFTRDADLAVAVASDDEAERLIRYLRGIGYEVQGLVEHEAAHRLATVRLTRSGGLKTPVLDLLFASSGIEAEIVADAESLEILPGLMMPVARVGHLLILKLLSQDDERRPQDSVDLRALLLAASAVERERMRGAAALITVRGYHRGRDLFGAMETLLAPRLRSTT